jgi:hypothetical protein
MAGFHGHKKNGVMITACLFVGQLENAVQPTTHLQVAPTGRNREQNVNFLAQEAAALFVGLVRVKNGEKLRFQPTTDVDVAMSYRRTQQLVHKVCFEVQKDQREEGVGSFLCSTTRRDTLSEQQHFLVKPRFWTRELAWVTLGDVSFANEGGRHMSAIKTRPHDRLQEPAQRQAAIHDRPQKDVTQHARFSGK